MAHMDAVGDKAAVVQHDLDVGRRGGRRREAERDGQRCRADGDGGCAEGDVG